MSEYPEKQMVFFLALHLIIFLFINSAMSSQTTYVVQMEKSEMPALFSHHLHWYTSILNSAVMERARTDTEEQSDRLIYTYDTAFHGFAAKLSSEEVEMVKSSPGVVAVYPETVYQLHTTRSPEFLSLAGNKRKNMWASNSNYDVIIGVLDTGIWPESPSFNDEGMPPIPRRWRGTCESGREFNESNCNKKIIGARVFSKGYEVATGVFNEKTEYKSARDQDGHGTHTAATAAGVTVSGANLLGYASGTARGMSPGARVAAYKVCWTAGCFSSDLVSAIDQAVYDGVDVLSISLGSGMIPYHRDSLSVAAFGAMEMGVFVSCSAGNAGPSPISLTNVAPWIATVGASTMDRDFPANVNLGSGRNLTGVSLYKGRVNLSPLKQYQLVYFGSNSTRSDPKSLCLAGSLDRKSVSGKIVICDRGVSTRVRKGEVVKEAGGIGMILCNTEVNGEELVADAHLLPAITVGESAGKEIKRYAKMNTRPTGTFFFEGTKLGIKPSPVVAAFSSRGPNILTLEILKPDMVAPGVNILAGWTHAVAPTGLSVDRRRVGFNILSGTSMSCPHVSGVAALLKANHPDWSPSAIKSALMTTAYVNDNTGQAMKDAATGKPSDPFAHGAGHINPAKANAPGLIYDITPQDYFEFLCSQKMTALELKVFAKNKNRTCENSLKTSGDLNYPAISAVLSAKAVNTTLTVRRTVTNVGPAVSNYHFTVSIFKGLDIEVRPKILKFTSKNQKITYKVSFTLKTEDAQPGSGNLIWNDGVHSVRSPIVVSLEIPL